MDDLEEVVWEFGLDDSDNDDMMVYLGIVVDDEDLTDYPPREMLKRMVEVCQYILDNNLLDD